MKGLQGVVLGGAMFAMAMATHAQDTRPESWQEAVKAERQFCMSDVCLGMTVKEVQAIAGTQLKPFPSNQWKRNCEGDFRNWEMADFIAKDGTRYSVGFRDFPGDEVKEGRFRVQSVALIMPLEWNDFRLLTVKIALRYDMRAPKGGGDLWDQEWSKAGEGFTLRLNAMFSEPPKTSLLSLSAKSSSYPMWLKMQPKCKAEAPAKSLPDV